MCMEHQKRKIRMKKNPVEEDRQDGLQVHTDLQNNCIEDGWGKHFCIGTDLCFDGYHGKTVYFKESYEKKQSNFRP